MGVIGEGLRAFTAHGGACRALAVAALVFTGASAQADVRIMAIGDSITWGFSYEGPDQDLSTVGDNDMKSNGGWRSPFFDAINSNPNFVESFTAVGVKGDNNPSTVPNEVGRAEHPDGFDVPGRNHVLLHEGYSGWVIDRSPYAPGDLTNGRDGITDNLSSNGGAINPANADIIMLMIGVNDVSRNTLAAGVGPNGAYLSAAARLNNLILEIKDINPAAIVLVSNLLPVQKDRPTNLNPGIDSFNTDLLSFFGGVFGDDELDSGVVANHNTLSSTYLLNVNQFFLPPDRSDPSNFLYDHNNDYLHPTPDGYAYLASFYEDRLLGLEINVIPSPATGVMVLAGLLGLLVRRRSAAA